MAKAPLGAKPPLGWVLALELVAPDRLVTLLSNGLWGCTVAEGPWPPIGAQALPGAMVEALRRLEGVESLRLQMRTTLDPWPWEHELAAALGAGCRVLRYLSDLIEPGELRKPALQPTPLVAPGDRTTAHLALVQAARLLLRPLVLTEPWLTTAQRQALERSLRSHWRDPLLLSQVLARALIQLGLPQTCCRLYGDGRAQLADTEQGWRPVTALSFDLVSSTRLMQTIGAEAYAHRLQTYHERCREVILRFQGSAGAPQGNDGLMAYFGFPLAVEDAASHALNAAWQLARGVAELGLQVRVGVASGHVVVSDQQAFGPDVHLAARLREAALPGQILVAASTRDRVGAGFALEHWGEDLSLKDFAQQTSAYRLSALRPALHGKLPLRAACGFVGRETELQLLHQAWATAGAGQLQWCPVHGEAGIGKSRLLLEFAQQLRGKGQRCMELTGRIQAGSSPFAAVVDALRQHWSIGPDMDAVLLQHRLADLLPRQGRGTDDLGELAQLLALSPQSEAAPVPLAPPTSGGQRRWSDLLLDCLRALIGPGPFCLIVDDAQWLDPSSVELLRRLREAFGSHPLLVVLAERTEAGRAMGLSGAAALELHGLAETEARELAGQLGAGLPERLRQRVIERAEGIPLYLEESLRMLSHRDGEAGDDVPAKLEDMLMVRLDELGPDRALAQLVSVLGREFSAVHLEALLEQSDAFVARARQQGSLGALLASGLLQALDGSLPGYRFKHGLIRDVAYNTLPTQVRTRLHGLCADLIEQHTPGLWQQRPEHLAQHLQAAGRPEQARRAWLAAAQLSASRHAHHETVELAQSALALDVQVPAGAERARSTMQLQLLRASAQIALLGYGSAEVETAYEAAEQAGRQLADAAQTLRIRLGLEACYVMRGDLPRAAALAQEGVAATDWSDDARLALQSRWALANVRFHQGDWQAALAGFDDCLANYRPELHRRSSVQDPAIMCLGYSSWVHFELGQADEALDRIDRMLALAETLQHPFSSGVALGFAASMKRLCGDVEGAWPHALEAVRICERGGFQVWLAHAWMVRGQLRSDSSDIRGGDDDMARGYGLWVGGGARISCATYLVTRAELLLRQGRTAQAVAELDQAWRTSEQIGEHYYQAELLRLQGLCAWQAGDPGRAEPSLRQALALAEAQRKPGLALRCALSLGAQQAAQGRWQTAAQPLQGLLAGLHQHGRCRDARWARQALQHWSAGRRFDAIEHIPWEPL